MKEGARFFGLDDSPFTFRQARVRLVGVVTQGPQYIEGVLSDWCDVDGDDATAQIAAMIAGSRFASTIRCVFLNGVAVGGFNVLDLDTLHEAAGVPIVAIARSEPDMAAIEAALTKRFDAPQERLRRFRAASPTEVRNGRHLLWISARGLTRQQTQQALEMTTVRGALPEPLRLAHVIASGLALGESRGKA